MIKLKNLIEKCHCNSVAVYCYESTLLYVSTRSGTIGDLGNLLSCPVLYFDVRDNMLVVYIDKI